jgi:tRNA(Ile)-lysidine synthase
MSKFESSPVTKAFQKSVKSYLPDSLKLIAGVSGGPDSMALLYLLHRFDMDAVVVHCNYQLRGENSEKDQRLVEKMSAFWGFECVSVKLENESMNNFQAWARERRYEIFYDLKREFQADFITTAHHQDDQIETILQRMLRGAGLTSWRGIRPIDEQLFRPLLEVSKGEILKFVEEFNIPYRIDNSNEESTYARNFLRHNWFPEMQKFFPGWRHNILKLRDRAEEYQLMSDEILKSVRLDSKSLKREPFMELSEKIRPAILVHFIESATKEIDISSSIRSISENLIELQSGKTIQLSNNYKLVRDRDLFILNRIGDEKKASVELKKEDLSQIKAVYGHQMSIEEFDGIFEDNRLYADLSKLSFPITVRHWKDGDRFQPLGMEGTQLISDHLTNRKVSSAQKNDAFLIESFDGNICAVIFPHNTSDDQIGTISESVRCSSETKKVLVICNQT